MKTALEQVSLQRHEGTETQRDPQNCSVSSCLRGYGRLTVPLAAAVAALLIAWGLKQHYSDARADDLLWILTPTTQLVGAMTGSPFTLQPGEGYLSHERLFLIEKSCAGVNFMVAAFGMLVFSLFHRARTAVSAGSVLAVSLLAGYTAAVVVNAVRIAMAMWLAAHPVALSISSAAAHRLEGILVYFCGLMVLYEASQRLDRRALRLERAMSGARAHIAGALRRAAVPLAAYYAVTLALPLANGAAFTGARFVVHAVMVLVGPLVAVVLVCGFFAVTRACLRAAIRGTPQL